MAFATESLRQPLPDRPDCRLSPVSNTDLPQYVLDVLLDGLIANVQRLRDFLIGQSQGQLEKDFVLATR